MAVTLRNRQEQLSREFNLFPCLESVGITSALSTERGSYENGKAWAEGHGC